MNDALESETRRNCEMMSLIETEFSGGKKVSLNGSSDSQYHGLIYYENFIHIWCVVVDPVKKEKKRTLDDAFFPWQIYYHWYLITLPKKPLWMTMA